MSGKNTNTDALNKIVSDARRHQDERAKTYREKALKLYPWICGRCEREFTRANLPELTVHHRNHNHDDNPADGSNWELLCLYCHDNEHQRQLEVQGQSSTGSAAASNTLGATHNPFADLKGLLGKK